jgi:hypothetical protein
MLKRLLAVVAVLGAVPVATFRPNAFPVPASGEISFLNRNAKSRTRAFDASYRQHAAKEGAWVLSSSSAMRALFAGLERFSNQVDRIAVPEMRRFGYRSDVATGVIAAGGTVGILIPPSVVLAIYGFMTNQDVGRLFIAGIVPACSPPSCTC